MSDKKFQQVTSTLVQNEPFEEIFPKWEGLWKVITYLLLWGFVVNAGLSSNQESSVGAVLLTSFIIVGMVVAIDYCHTCFGRSE